MSVQFDETVARLHGDCPASDAEALATALQLHPDLVVDVAEATHLHTAVVQVLFAFDADIRGAPRDNFLSAIVGKRGKEIVF